MSAAYDLLMRLWKKGVQVWQNRGRLYCGPLDQVDNDERALLAHHKADVVTLVKRWRPPPEFRADLIAPRPTDNAGWEGRASRKPWHYEVAVILPHLGTFDLLTTAIACWRQQTVSPYLIVVDTGSDAATLEQVEFLRSFDTEIHYLRCHAWRHSSQPVSAALDLAFAVCQQDRALLTHVDVFPRHYQVIEQLLSRVTPSAPVVGYQMSPRVGSEEWQQCVSHSLTMCDMRAMRRVRANWNLLAVLEADNEVDQRFLHWPDTETQFGRACRAEGIVFEFLGSEANCGAYETDLVTHWRSDASLRYYDPAEADRRHPGLTAWLQEAYNWGRAGPLPELPADPH